jgi:hypothetical protein
MSKSASDSRSKVVLICGIPGSGKTTFCAWLDEHKGFDHLDFDLLLQGQGTPAHLHLVHLLRTSPKDFIHKVLKKKKPTAIDWGFPIKSLDLVRFFKLSGIGVWWFDGDREAARQRFIDRRTVTLDAFKQQMSDIEGSWSEITEVVGDHVIYSVAKGPTNLPQEDIFAGMFSRSPLQ